MVVHKRQAPRCAPEQVRPSTPDELQLVETPQMELLGIKHLIDKSMLNSRQYVDLVLEEYPSASGEAPEPLPGSTQSPPVVDCAVGSEPQGIFDDEIPLLSQAQAQELLLLQCQPWNILMIRMLNSQNMMRTMKRRPMKVLVVVPYVGMYWVNLVLKPCIALLR